MEENLIKIKNYKIKITHTHAHTVAHKLTENGRKERVSHTSIQLWAQSNYNRTHTHQLSNSNETQTTHVLTHKSNSAITDTPFRKSNKTTTVTCFNSHTSG